MKHNLYMSKYPMLLGNFDVYELKFSLESLYYKYIMTCTTLFHIFDSIFACNKAFAVIMQMLVHIIY